MVDCIPHVGFTLFAHNTLQVPRVARQCMVSLCEGVAELGATTEIVSIKLKMDPAEPQHTCFRSLYGVDAPVRFTSYRLPGLRVGEGAKLVAAFRLAAYAWHLLRPDTARRFRESACEVVSGRNMSVLALSVILKRLRYRQCVVLADVHGPATSRLARWVHRHVDGNVCISGHLAAALKREADLTDDQVRVAHSGVKPERFVRRESRDVLAARLSLDRSKPIICYSGKVHYRYEEVAYLIEVARLLRNEATLVIVGGRPDQIPPWQGECCRAQINNVVFTGFLPPAEVPAYLHAADLLVMYYSPSPLNEYRSPGKLFEYLASGSPLVASRFRGIEEVVTDGENGFLVEPYQPALLAARIRELLGERQDFERIGRRAMQTAQRFTWRARAGVFLDYAREIGARAIRSGA